MSAIDTRRNRLALIHMAAKQLGIADDDGDAVTGRLSTYRTMLHTLTGKTSTGAMTPDELYRVVQHMERLGFASRPKKWVGHYPGTPHNIDRVDRLKKVEAQLADMGLPWSYANGLAQRMFGVDRVAWIKQGEQLDAIIAALHVEQEKRQGLATVDRLLSALGRQRDYAAELAQQIAPRFGGNWQRNREMLKLIAHRLADLVEGV